MSEMPPPSPVPEKRPPFEARALWWLIVCDAAWTVPELIANIASALLSPVCFFGAAIPVFIIQRQAGDSRTRAAAKAVFLGFLAGLPFPVAGTAFGAALLAWMKLGTKSSYR